MLLAYLPSSEAFSPLKISNPDEFTKMQRTHKMMSYPVIYFLLLNNKFGTLNVLSFFNSTPLLLKMNPKVLKAR